jgi:hypothetical protein
MRTRVLSVIATSAVFVTAIACRDSPTEPSTETVTFTALLSPANEVPPVINAEASGNGTATVTLVVNRDGGGGITSAIAGFQVNLAGFPAGTALTMAHIHRGAIGANGDIVVDTGLTAGEVVLTSGAGGFTKPGVGVTPAIAQELLSGPSAFYVNVHSVLNGTGMARGQMVREDD